MQTWKGLSPGEIAKKIFELLEVKYTEKKEDPQVTFEANIRGTHLLRVITSSQSRQIGIEIRSLPTYVRLSGIAFNSCSDISYELERMDRSSCCSPGAGQSGEVDKKIITLRSQCGEATIEDAGPGNFFGVDATIY